MNRENIEILYWLLLYIRQSNIDARGLGQSAASEPIKRGSQGASKKRRRWPLEEGEKVKKVSKLGRIRRIRGINEGENTENN